VTAKQSKENVRLCEIGKGGWKLVKRDKGMQYTPLQAVLHDDARATYANAY
jgi:hypothetical protein